MAEVVRVDFGEKGERPLKARHRQLREAVRMSGKPLNELIVDPFGGWPFLLQAMVNAKTAKAITLDEASELIDAYRDRHQGLKELGRTLDTLCSHYVSVEATPTDDEQADAEAQGTTPNADSPDARAASGD